MTIFNFTKQERDTIVQKIQQYFTDELNQDIGQFDAGFLLDFVSEEVGPYFYNKGVQDSQAMLQKRIDGVLEAIDSLEKPISTRRKTEK